MGLNDNLKLLVHLSALDINLKQFKESGFDSLSSLMVREDIGQLVLGARGKVLTLSLDDITKQTSEVWPLFVWVDRCALFQNGDPFLMWKN